MRVTWTEAGTGESDDDKVAYSVSLSTGSWKPHFACVVVG
jgi:hypothetical protein